jgi:LacI family transcriptional regulator
MSFVEELGYTPNLLAKSLALKKSYHIAALLPEAGAQNPYWEMPVSGMNRAAEELNDYHTRFSLYRFDPGDESSFIRQFRLILAASPDGIILAPHFQEATLRQMPDCEASHIPVILIDNDLDSGQVLGFFGQDARLSGSVAAKLMHYGLPQYATVFVLNLARNKVITRHMHLREEGFRQYFNEVVPGHRLTLVSTAIDLAQDMEPDSTLYRLLAEHPDVAGIFVTNSRIHQVARFFDSYGKDRLLLAGYDLIFGNLEYLEKGIVDFLICQKPEEQGYRSALAMFNHLLLRRPVEKVNYSPIDIIVKENAGYYKPVNFKNSL